MRIDRDWFKIWTKPKYPAFADVVQSWHTPLFFPDEDKDSIKLSCCTTWGIFKDAKLKPKIILASVFVSDSELHPELFITHAKNFYNDYLNSTDKIRYSDRNPTQIVLEVEEDTYHNSIIQSLLKRQEMPVHFLRVERYGDTLEQRLASVASALADGYVYLCSEPDNPNALRDLDAYFMKRVVSYPEPVSYSVISSLVIALLYCKQRGWIKHSAEKEPTLKSHRPKEAYY